jgi:hypothetical protein
MATSQLVTDYIQHGTHASRPATPNVGTGVAAFYYETDTLSLFAWNGSAWVLTGPPYIQIREEQASGTSGGTFTSGAWQTRVLTTKVVDTASLASLASNQITLAAGTYYCRIAAPAFDVDGHQAKLYNVTGTADLLLGPNVVSGAIGNVGVSATVTGRFTLSVSSVLEVRHRCVTTKASTGFGLAASWGTEVYTTVELWPSA